MRHYSWIMTLLAAMGLAAGCSTTGDHQMDQESPANLRGDIGNGAFGEAVPGAYEETGASRVAPSTAEGHNHTGNGAFGEAP